ncbi:MAG TPA: hypothetical protein VGJ04_02035 [Pirellulales bacterium]
MNSNQRSPLWPYLLVLTSLFLLSLAVPRGWQQETGSDDWQPRPRHRAQAQARLRANDHSVAIVRPSAENILAPEAGQDQWTSGAADSTVLVGGPASALIAPIAETVAKKIADFRRFGALQNSRMLSGGESNSNGVNDQQPVSQWNEQQKTETANSAYWPTPSSLIAQLDRLAENDECRGWAQQVQELCTKLCQSSPANPQQAAAIVQQLETLEQQAGTLDHTLKSDKAAAEFRRARYALRRRLALWNVVFQAEQRSAVYAEVPSADIRRQQLKQALEGAQDWIHSLAYSDAWQNYLLLNDVAQLTDANPPISNDQAQHIARQALARLMPAQMTETQRRVLQDRTLEVLADQLRSWAGEAVDVRDVLAKIEQYENSGLPTDARYVATALRRLNWSAAEQDRQIAHQLDEHYRNANIRIALTATFFNRMVPEQPVANGVVNDTILGAWVNGTSKTNAQLSVKLIPDPKRLHLWFDAQGTVDSSTLSTSGPATFSNDGRSNFLVHKAVVIDDRGLWIANAVAEANSNTQLTGVSTSYDDRPLLGPIVRNIAISQHDSMRGAAEAETDSRVAAQAIKSVDAEVKEHLTEAEQALRKNIYDPLAKLGVAPEPVSLETSQQRLTIRLRIAGQNQLGGHTARPQALSDSLASMQIHESALNNILDQLQLAGHSFSLSELYQHVAEQLSRSQTDAPVDLPTNVKVTFAAKDPIRLRCQNGVVSLTLAVAELQQNGRRWNDFSVTANYAPEIEDLHVRLVRQGPIELSGEAKGQPEIALRGVFSKMFPRERSFELIPKAIADNRNLGDMRISQCVVEDGWIALSLGPQRDDGPSAMRVVPTLR